MAEAATARSPATCRATLIGVAGVVLEALPEGALWWADERLLVVADLHLEKGSSFARRGQMLPPYDTHETLARLSRLVAGCDPRDGRRARRQLPRRRRRRAPLAARPLRARRAADRPRLDLDRRQSRSRAAHGLAGTPCDALAVGPLIFRHEPAPVAAGRDRRPSPPVGPRPRAAAGRCAAAASPATAIASSCPPSAPMPAGSTSSTAPSPACSPPPTFRAFMLGDDRVYPVGRRALRPD